MAKNKNSTQSDNLIILFDGVCNLCNATVHFVIRHEKQRFFLFASLQSAYGRRLLRRYDLTNRKVDSIVLLKRNKAYIKSDAILQIIRRFSFPWSVLTLLRFLPLSFRDSVYDFIARNRYRWFGKKKSCPLPTAELLDRFPTEPSAFV